ncbi:MAG: hypothetical protein ACOC5E_00765 [Acidobacteriota bacterium]
MTKSLLWSVTCCLALVSCGGEATTEHADEPESAAPEVAETETPEGSSGQEAAAGSRGTVLTEVPDACEFLTRSDAEELLDEPTGHGKRLDAGGWNCVYDSSSSGHRLVLNMHVGRDLSVQSTQIGMTIEACRAEVVERFEDLGLGGALYRQADDPCGGGTFLWVVSPATFSGSPGRGERDVTGPIHFTVTRSSGSGAARDDVPVLREAAERVLDGLSS